MPIYGFCVQIAKDDWVNIDESIEATNLVEGLQCLIDRYKWVNDIPLTRVEVFLTEVGEKKIQAIKEVRAFAEIGLKEAKEIVESVLSYHPKSLGFYDIKYVIGKLKELNSIKLDLSADAPDALKMQFNLQRMR